MRGIKRRKIDYLKDSVLLIGAIISFIFIINFASAAVRINEVMPHSNNALGDEWVELYNDGNEAVKLAGWIIADAVSNDSFSLNIPAKGYAIIIDNSIICSSVNVSNQSCTSLSTIGGGLNDNADNLSLFDNQSSKIANFSWNSDLRNSGSSFGFNGSWLSCNPTPGFENNCILLPSCSTEINCGSWSDCYSNGQKNRTCINTNSSCQNSTKIETEGCEYSQTKASLGIEWTASKIVNGEEFEIYLKAFNLEDKSYAIKVWITPDGEDTIISDRYDSEEEKWESGTYWIYGYFRGPGNKTDYLNLRIRSEYSDFLGNAKIYFKIKNETEIGIQRDITIIEEDDGDSTSITKQTSQLDSYASENLVSPAESSEDVIVLGSARKKAQENSIIYKSKNEYIKEYSVYLLALMCLLLLILFILSKNKHKKNGKKN